MPFLPTPSSWQQFPIGSIGFRQRGTIVPDSLGNLYFPSNSGVAKYNIASDSLSFIDMGDGLVSDSIVSIDVDANDDLWILNDTFLGAPSAVILQKYDTGLNSVVINVDLVTLFGVKASYGGGKIVKINPFNGHVFVGERSQSFPGKLAIYNGSTWSNNTAAFYGLEGSASFQYIEFLTIDKWWLGYDFPAAAISLVFWDDFTSTTVYAFDYNDFGAKAVDNIALLSSGRLIVITSAGNIHRIDSGVITDTGVPIVSSMILLDGGEIVWTAVDAANNAGVSSFNDPITTKLNFPPATIGGNGTGAGGADNDGNVWFLRSPGATNLMVKGVIATVPIFITIDVRAVTVDSIDVQAEADSNCTAYLVVVPDGDPAPTSLQVKEGKDSTGTPVAAGFADTDTLVANVENNPDEFIGTTLAPSTDYDVYVVVEGSGGLQSTPTKLDATTLTPVGPTDPVLDPSIMVRITTGGQYDTI